MNKPNIILIFCDQMRGDCLGIDGNKIIQTPNMNYLAACGVHFSHAYSAVPSCLPARATLWSGQNQWHTGVLGMGSGQGPIPNDFPHTIAGELTNAGYQTHMIGKGHFHPQQTLMGFEFTELDESGRTLKEGFYDEYRTWFKENAPKGVTPDDHGIDWNSWLARPWHTHEHLHPSAWTMSRAIDFLKNRDMNRSFFLNISFARPHSPYVPPQSYFDMYLKAKTPAPYESDWSAMHDNKKDMLSPNAWRGKMTKEQIHRARSGYYGEISFIDTQIGRLINWMTRFQGDAFANTWIIFSSDHGDMQGDHNLWRKTYAYEGSSRIPLIITPPPAIKTKCRLQADEVTELRDIMPTIMDIANLPTPETVDGKSLLPLIEKQDSNWREYIHGEHCASYNPKNEMQFVTDGKRKFIWFPRIDCEQFFDLEKDVGETNNIINKPERQEEIALWRSYLINELKNRNCGWVKNGKLTCTDNKPLISPLRNTRWQGKISL